MIDTHCHLTHEFFASDREEVISNALDSGIEHMITIACTIEEGEECLLLAEEYEQISCTIGVHPHQSDQLSAISNQRLCSLLQSEKVVGVGEVGLDYYYDNAERSCQLSAFRSQLEIAKEFNIPAVIHCREALDDLVSVLREVGHEKFVLHCCTYPYEEIQPILELGGMVSFTGIATYPRSSEIRETIAGVPEDRFMIETDAPYLTPEPHRGDRNDPSFLGLTAQCIADVRGISVEEVDEITTKNAVEFFSL